MISAIKEIYEVLWKQVAWSTFKGQRTHPSGNEWSLCLELQKEWVLSHLILHCVNAGEGVEKREPSCTVGGNVNWCRHYGEPHGSSFKN